MSTSLKSIIIILYLVITSCTSYHPLLKYNYTNDSRLINPEIPLTIKYFGDTKFQDLEKVDKNYIKTILRPYNQLELKNLLAYAKTNVNPEYETLLFLSNQKEGNDSLRLLSVDSTRLSLIYKLQKDDQSLFMLMRAMNDNKGLKSMLKDGADIMNSVSFRIDSTNALSYADVFNQVRKDINYISATKTLIDAPVSDSLQQQWMQFQYLATINSFMQNNPTQDSLIQQYERKRIDKQSKMLSKLDNTKVFYGDEVIDKILSEAKHTRVVMVNENHWYPKHRIFTTSLLKGLKEIGYTHLALEALTNPLQASKINEKRPYPTLNSGYYIQEAYFAHLVRKASALGFKLVSYENQDPQINRELGQAQQLMEILEDPKAKVLVHAGIDHILESPTENGKRMATHFKEMSAIDPLSINQVEFVGGSSHELSLIPFELIKGQTKKINDYYLINQIKPSLEKVYPEKDFQITATTTPKSNPALVKFYNQEEYSIYKENAVPILNIYSTSDRLTINLPRGMYKVVIYYPDGKQNSHSFNTN
ncbi:hypothetical protein SAMN04487907_11128 [Zunongwangia mangrovi]|uniref:Uncharacterized protein n=1 Tax=Zunongwangia mangrovi TaxID=1334022 RepID=A0A1I1MS31_9FLAO|nr:hypothetical protein SAMN04487907_11128 [Zunongwangia mangrovi]